MQIIRNWKVSAKEQAILDNVRWTLIQPINPGVKPEFHYAIINNRNDKFGFALHYVCYSVGLNDNHEPECRRITVSFDRVVKTVIWKATKDQLVDYCRDYILHNPKHYGMKDLPYIMNFQFPSDYELIEQYDRK